MPELPEVHTIVSDLRKNISNHVINNVVVSYRSKIFPSRGEFARKVKGSRVTGVRRVAKNILIDLDSSYTIGFHLAMTGRLLLRQNYDKNDKWVKLVLVLGHNGTTKELRFTDMRTFGKVILYKGDDINELYAKYGPEPLNDELTPDEFLKIIQKKRTNVKNALLDQGIISGLGNIYATDTLFLAGVHPETTTKDLDLNTAGKLLEAARSVLKEGIKNRGSTLPDKMYVDIFGNEGSHQHYFKIYMKEICPNCDNKVEYIQLNSRGTYFCPSCQIKPNGNENPELIA